MSLKSYVTVFHNLSVESLENVRKWLEDKHFKFVKSNLKRPEEVEKVVGQVDRVFHLAANLEVRTGETDPKTHFEGNLVAKFNLFEAIRKGASARFWCSLEILKSGWPG